MSVYKYAKHRGVDHQAVRRAIRENRISQRPDGTIDSEVADKEWYANTDPTLARGDAAKAALEKAADEFLSTEDDSEPEEDEGEEGTEGEEAPTKRIAPEGVEKQAGIRKSLDQARAIKESYRAELARLEYEEQAGKLVSVESVREEAFKLARSVRDSLLALPDRLAGELAGETNQFKIHQRLNEEIRRALVTLKVEGDGEIPG